MSRAYAVFQCVGPKGLTGEARVPLKPGATEEQVKADAAAGANFAARRFKREHELHPCTRIRCTFLRIDP